MLPTDNIPLNSEAAWLHLEINLEELLGYMIPPGNALAKPMVPPGNIFAKL